MATSEPKSMTLLVDYLNDLPYPTEVDIAILDDSDSYPYRAYAKVDNHLGIHAPDLPRLARDFREEYASLRRRRRRRGAADGDEDGLASRISNATACLLLVCPDHSTAWADRRRALPKDGASIEDRVLRKELEFCNLLLTQHSKAPSSWAHRKWVGKKLTESISESILDGNVDDELDATNELRRWAVDEMRTCSTVAEKYPKNYHAWTHRRWVCQSLFALFREAASNHRDTSLAIEAVFRILENDLSTTQGWMKTHVTDHSAVHYQGQALRLLLEVGMHPASEHVPSDAVECRTNGNNRVASVWAWDLLTRSMEISRSSRFAEYEVTWIHRRMCGAACLDHFSSEGSGSGDDDQKLNEFITIEMHDLAATYLKNDDCPKSKVYALSYVVWIIRQMKGTKLWETCHGDELMNLEKEVVNVLARNEAIVGNVWRIMNNRV